MWDMLYAFGIGISFVFGVGMGAFLFLLASKDNRKELTEETRVYNTKVLEVLTERAMNDKAVIDALDRIADK